MRWLRRRRARGAGPADAASAGPTAAGLPAQRIERAVLALATHTHQLGIRLDRLERRVENQRLDQMDLVSHDELLDARLHSAKVATEVARLSIELRSAIQQVHDRVADWEDREWQITTPAEPGKDVGPGVAGRRPDLLGPLDPAEEEARRRHPSMAYR